MTDFKHKQVNVVCFGDNIEVDEGIADLLQMIWKSGFMTFLSCEDNIDNCIWINFPLSDFKSILRIAYKIKPYDGLLDFIDNKTHSVKFQWADDGYVDDTDNWINGDNLEFDVSLRFDKSLKNEFMDLWKKTFVDV